MVRGQADFFIPKSLETDYQLTKRWTRQKWTNRVVSG